MLSATLPTPSMSVAAPAVEPTPSQAFARRVRAAADAVESMGLDPISVHVSHPDVEDETAVVLRMADFLATFTGRTVRAEHSGGWRHLYYSAAAGVVFTACEKSQAATERAVTL